MVLDRRNGTGELAAEVARRNVASGRRSSVSQQASSSGGGIADTSNGDGCWVACGGFESRFAAGMAEPAVVVEPSVSMGDEA